MTDRDADFAAVAAAHAHFGRLDVVVNNAGYGQFGLVEELSEADARDQMETNLFGALWVTQAALPFLRVQGSGHILQVSSVGGISAFPNVGMYHASKWALEGISQSLAQEVAGFGIHVTLIEPAVVDRVAGEDVWIGHVGVDAVAHVLADDVVADRGVGRAGHQPDSVLLVGADVVALHRVALGLLADADAGLAVVVHAVVADRVVRRLCSYTGVTTTPG